MSNIDVPNRIQSNNIAGVQANLVNRVNLLENRIDNIGSLRGPRGFKGATGPKGDVGPTGPAGIVENGSIYPHHLGSFTNVIPTHFGEQVKIDQNVNNLRIRLRLVNFTGQSLEFAQLQPDDRVQVWICYYKPNGILANEDIEHVSSAFFPESTVINDSPSSIIEQGNTYSYDITVNNIHHQKPENADYWSIFVRPVSYNLGTHGIGAHSPIDSLAFTNFFT